MKPDHQSTTVETTPEGQIRVHYDWQVNGLQMGGEFVFESSASDWLAECLARAADEDLPDTDAVMPPDHFLVYLGGGQRYDDMNVTVSNHRDPASVYGKLYVLLGMDRDVARTLADQLLLLQRQKAQSG